MFKTAKLNQWNQRHCIIGRVWGKYLGLVEINFYTAIAKSKTLKKIHSSLAFHCQQPISIVHTTKKNPLF